MITENEKARMEAQFRLDVPSKRLFTALIKEYFAKYYVKPELKKKIKQNNISFESQNAVIKRFLKEGKSPENIEELMGTPVLSILDIKKKMEEEG